MSRAYVLSGVGHNSQYVNAVLGVPLRGPDHWPEAGTESTLAEPARACSPGAAPGIRYAARPTWHLRGAPSSTVALASYQVGTT